MKSLLQQQFQWHLRLLDAKIVVNHKEGIYIFFFNICICLKLDYCLGLPLFTDAFQGNV